jgi:hypothetical protein
MKCGTDCTDRYCTCNNPTLKVVIATDEYIYWEVEEE